MRKVNLITYDLIINHYRMFYDSQYSYSPDKIKEQNFVFNFVRINDEETNKFFRLFEIRFRG